MNNDFYDPEVDKYFVMFASRADPQYYDMGSEPIWITNQRQACPPGGRSWDDCENPRRSGVLFWPG